MKYLITNNSSDYELLNDEVISPNESRVLESGKVILSNLSSAFTVKVIKDTNLDSLGNDTSLENDVSGVDSADESSTIQDSTEESGQESSDEAKSEESDEVLDYLHTLAKDDLKKILANKNDTDCTSRSEYKIAAYIRSTYPECTKEDFISILGE